MIHAIAWMNLDNMSDERSQLQKAVGPMILFIFNAQNREIYREKSLVVVSDWESGMRVMERDC